MPADPPIAALHSHLGYWLRTVSNAVSQNFGRAVESEGVTVAEWVMLRMLHDVERIAPSLLAERMGMTRGAISKLADRLVEKGLVARRADPADGRAQTLSLKPAGRALVPRLAAAADRNDATFFEALAPDEREQLRQLLMKIVVARELRAPPTD